MATSESRQLPGRQRIVIIGAGIVGNSVAYHLSRLDETEITLLDKGPLPNPVERYPLDCNEIGQCR